jgi:hypothetical protein
VRALMAKMGILQIPTDCTGSVMRIWLSTAQLAFRLKGAAAPWITATSRDTA